MYRITINKEEKIFETFETEEQAIARLREMIEADGNHIFAGMTNWTSLNKAFNRNRQVQWMFVENGMAKMMSKSILWHDEEAEAKREAIRSDWEKEFSQKWREMRKNFGINA